MHSAAAASGDIHAPSTSGQVPVRTAAERKMAELNLEVEPMLGVEEDMDVAVGGGDEEGSLSEGTENDLLRDPPVCTSEEPRVTASGAAQTSQVDNVASPPVCRGEEPCRTTTITTQSNTAPISSVVESGDALPPREEAPRQLFESPGQGGPLSAWHLARI